MSVTIALGLIILGGGLGLLNWVSGVGALLKKSSTSFIPYLGGLMCLGGIYLHPVVQFGTYWWVALLIDFTLLPSIIVVLYQSIRSGKNHGNT